MFPSSSLIPMYIRLLEMKPIFSLARTASVSSPNTFLTAATFSNPLKYSVKGWRAGGGVFLLSLMGSFKSRLAGRLTGATPRPGKTPR